MALQSAQAFITGGGSGIGRGLAEALAQQGTRVIVAGRRADALEATARASPGMRTYVLDITDRASIERAAREVPALFGPIDCLINNAGVQRMHSLRDPLDPSYCDFEIDTNFRALLAMTAAFCPHLMAQPRASLINISSGLAFVPFARMPVYCATKAAVHSFTQSLRFQLRDSTVRVIEVCPPAVSTELHDYMGPKGREIGISVEAFVAEAMEGLNSGAEEIHVGDAKHLHARPQEAFERLNR